MRNWNQQNKGWRKGLEGICAKAEISDIIRRKSFSLLSRILRPSTLLFCEAEIYANKATKERRRKSFSQDVFSPLFLSAGSEINYLYLSKYAMFQLLFYFAFFFLRCLEKFFQAKELFWSQRMENFNFFIQNVTITMSFSFRVTLSLTLWWIIFLGE